MADVEDVDMIDDEAVSTFIAMTDASPEQAKTYLQASSLRHTL